MLHTLQVLYMCTLCDSTNINTIIEFVPNWQVVKTPTIISNSPALKVLQSTQVFFITKNSTQILIAAIPLCCIIVTIYYVNNTTYINHQLLEVKILTTCFSYSEPSSGQKRNIFLVHSVIVHSVGSHKCTITECTRTVIRFWPDDGSLKLKHVAKILTSRSWWLMYVVLVT